MSLPANLAAFVDTLPEDHREVIRHALRPREGEDGFFDAANAVVLRDMQRGAAMETSPFKGQRLQWSEMALAGDIQPVSYRIVCDTTPGSEHPPVAAITWEISDHGRARCIPDTPQASSDFTWTPINGTYLNGPHVFYDFFRSEPYVVSA